MNYIIVSKNELDHYFYKTNRNNKVIDFWRIILKKMPKELLNEVNVRRTDLVHISEGEFKLKGYKPYVFKSENAPEELRIYLDRFVVYVIDTSDNTFNTRKDVEQKLRKKEPKGRKGNDETGKVSFS